MRFLVVISATFLIGCAHTNDAIFITNVVNNATYDNIKYEIYLKMYNTTQKR